MLCYVMLYMRAYKVDQMHACHRAPARHNTRTADGGHSPVCACIFV